MAKMGRPPIPKSKQRRARIDVACTDADMRLQERAAAAAGLRYPQWVRARLRSAAERELRRS